MQEHEGNCSRAMRSESNPTPSGKGAYGLGESWVGPFGLLSVRTPSGASWQTQALSATCRDQPFTLVWWRHQSWTLPPGLLRDLTGAGWLFAGGATL